MSVRRVQVIWAGLPTAGGGLSTFYFNTTVGTAANCVSAVGNFLTATEDQRTTTLTWSTHPDVVTLSDAGVLEGTTSTSPASGVGIASSDQLSPTTQGLLRVLSSTVVAGRILRGRVFLPGATEGQNQANGVPTTVYKSDYDAAAAALIADANTTWVVWSRTHATFATVVSASTWASWAVLRSRRD